MIFRTRLAGIVAACLAGLCGCAIAGSAAPAATGGRDGISMTKTKREGMALRLVGERAHHVQMTKLPTGGWEIRTTGGDPYVFTALSTKPYDPHRAHVLAFEYFSTTGTDSLQVFFGPPIDERHSVHDRGLSVSEAWSEHAVDLAEAGRHWRRSGLFRLDFGRRAGKVVRIRNMVLREPTDRERKLVATREARRRAEADQERRLRAYLEAKPPCRITHVRVGEAAIEVAGELGNQKGKLVLGEVPMFTPTGAADPLRATMALEAGERFSMTVERYADGEGGRRVDRLFSRWVVARRTARGYEWLSHARYADEAAAMWDLPEEKPKGRKGLGGFHLGRGADADADLEALGIHSVTVNVVLTDILRSKAGRDTTAFEFNGRMFHASRSALQHYDRTLIHCAKRGIIVSAIVLIRHGKGIRDRALSKVFAHPDCHPSAQYSMANLTGREGFELYAAALDLLARRYSRPDKRYGRIHHWIMHNEVDAGWVWTNCGDKPAPLYMDLYHRSMRTAHYIARKYNPHARVFISLTHYWNWTVDRRFYLPKELLELLLSFSRAEGDFDWGIAQHPYPESLFEPKAWLDKKCDFTFETPLITYKNIEVLDAWVRQKRTFFRGRSQRTLHLTEQGLNSPDYGERALREQAAGMAYAWKKIKLLDSIESFHYHNWIDNRHEGGLRIGLRRFPDDKQAPLGKKPIWYVYAKLDTAEEDAACEFAKSVIGINNWSQIRHRGPIGNRQK